MHQHPNHHHKNEGKAKVVVFITFLAMLAEIGFGFYTNSMALLADGWHMAAHVLAIGLTWFAYAFARKHKHNTRFRHGTDKIYSLAGYTSAVILIAVAVIMAIESIERIMTPEPIKFIQAIAVACIGLVVNGISALVLHHKEEQRDHNIHAAYLHVLADVITSIFAISALALGKYMDLYWLDSIGGILSAIIIANWSIRLALSSGRNLLDYSKNQSEDSPVLKTP